MNQPQSTLSDFFNGNGQPGSGTPNYWSNRARQAVADLLSVSEKLPDQYRAIKQHSDPNLTPEGLEEARAAMRESLRSQVTQTARLAAETVGTALKEAENTAAPYRPSYDPADVAQLTRTEQAWNIAVRPQLDAGKTWPEIVDTLDHDGLLAVQRFAPQYESAKRDRFTQNEVPEVVENLRQLTDARVVVTAPDGPARDALRELVDVRRLHSAATRGATILANMQGDRDATMVSMAIKREAFAVGANPAAMQGASAA